MISIKNVSKWYGQFQVLTECTTEVKKGEVVVVCGPSGSGKSTLIKTVNGLEPFQQGEILVNGQSVGDKKTNLSKLRSKVGMVFQHFELFPHLSITENLTLAQIKVLGRGKDEAAEKGMKLLDRVGLKAHAHKYPGQLSGGQQQRVAIARAVDGPDRDAVRRADVRARSRDDQRSARRDGRTRAGRDDDDGRHARDGLREEGRASRDLHGQGRDRRGRPQG
jgi:ABC-type polar amino acid transport system ATPase subunit